MSNRRKYIAPEALPPRLPVWQGIVLWLLLDRIDASGIAWGVAGTMWGLWMIAAFMDFYDSDATNLSGFGRRK